MTEGKTGGRIIFGVLLERSGISKNVIEITIPIIPVTLFFFLNPIPTKKYNILNISSVANNIKLGSLLVNEETLNITVLNNSTLLTNQTKPKAKGNFSFLISYTIFLSLLLVNPRMKN